jgi:hypothetical protein
MAAAPPTTMNATSCRQSVVSSASKSVTPALAGLSAGAPQLLRELREGHRLAKALLYRQLQVFAN